MKGLGTCLQRSQHCDVHGLRLQVLAATKEDLASAGVNVGVLEAAAQQSRHSSNGHTTARSKTVLLLKNLPFEATEDSIYELFEHGGGCARMVLPRTRALALVELPDEQVCHFFVLWALNIHPVSCGSSSSGGVDLYAGSPDGNAHQSIAWSD